MIIVAPTMMLAGLAISLIAGAEPAPCPSVTVAVDVTSLDDVHNLTDAIHCTGVGVFNVTWHNSLDIEQRIDVSDQKHVIVTGFGFPTIRAGLNGDGGKGTTLDLGSTTGIFSVHNESSLVLKQLVLDGGHSENGGAVAVTFFSSLHVYDCGFVNNNSSTGGALSAYNSSEIYIDGITWFRYNSASLGGAISSSLSTIHVSGSTVFANNKAGVGGAIYADESTITVDGNTSFYNNSVEGSVTTIRLINLLQSASSGGAIWAGYSVVYIGGSNDFSNNRAEQYGGAVYASHSVVYLDGAVFFSNNTASAGGAFQVNQASFYLDGTAVFSDNYVWEYGAGGAIDAGEADIYMSGNTYFARNSGGAAGGAIYAYSSDVRVNGNTSFIRNTAGTGGAIALALSCNLSITGTEASSGYTFSDKGSPYSGFDSDLGYIGGVAFIENVATKLGGAIYLGGNILMQAGHATYRSNSAEYGGAIYVALAVDKLTEFSTCLFEGNQATDGGAVYLYTGTGLDIFTDCVFRDNFATFSGGAIFHTGRLRVSNTSFIANVVGADGPAIMSIGRLETLSNVSFFENEYRCPGGQYSYILAMDQNTFCTSCFDEVCARCANAGDGVPDGAQVQIDGIPLCAEPPSGVATLSRGATLVTLCLKKGYYRTSNHSHEVRQCYHEDACLGGNDAEKYCASGYEGPYCAVCARGFAPGTAYSCRACSRGTRQSAIGLAVAVGVVMLPMAVLLFSHLGSAVNEREEQDAEQNVGEVAGRAWKQKCRTFHSSLGNMLPLTAIKTVVTVWQIISQFAAIAGDIYPELYMRFVSKLNPFNLDLDFFFSYSCFVATEFYDHLLFATIAPPLVLLLLAGSYAIGKRRNISSESAMRVVRHKHQSAALYLALFVYSPVSYKVFQTFACDELDDGGTYLRADYSLSCLTPRHGAYEVYALIMVWVYPVGVPAVFAWLLARHRHDLVQPDRETMAHLQPFNGIWGAYRPSRYYYEVVECSRRIALTGTAAFVLPNSTAQIAIVLLVAFAFVFIYESFSPFQRKADAMLYRWGSGIIVTSVYIALLMKLEIGNDSTGAISAFSVVLIAANVAMLATVLIQTTLLVMEWRRVKLEAKLRAAAGLERNRTPSLYSRYTGREE